MPRAVSSPSTIRPSLAAGRTLRPTWGASPERWLLAREARQHLQSAIAALPEHQRLVLILRDVGGCSTEEVCNALGFQKTTARVLLHRARAKVRAAL